MRVRPCTWPIHCHQPMSRWENNPDNKYHGAILTVNCKKSANQAPVRSLVKKNSSLSLRVWYGLFAFPSCLKCFYNIGSTSRIEYVFFLQPAAPCYIHSIARIAYLVRTVSVRIDDQSYPKPPGALGVDPVDI